MRNRIHLAAWLTCAGLACGGSGAGSGERCYRSPESVLLGPIDTASRQNGKPPGWLWIRGLPAADSGAVELVDAEGATLRGSWRRASPDSLSVVAADDFLRVQLRLAFSDSTVAGEAVAMSDADVERDASGRLRDFRREWTFTAARAPCDSATWTR